MGCRRILVAVLAVALAGAACGDGDGQVPGPILPEDAAAPPPDSAVAGEPDAASTGPDAGGDGGVGPDEAKCLRMADAWCGKRHECEGVDAQACKDAIDERLHGTCAERASAFRHLTADEVEACASDVEGWTCQQVRDYDDWGTVPAVCEGILS
jgi:hypothetical protein